VAKACFGLDFGQTQNPLLTSWVLQQMKYYAKNKSEAIASLSAEK